MLVCWGPYLTDRFDWRDTLLIIGASCVVFAIMLEPLRSEFDSDKDMTRKFRLSDFKGTMTLVLGQTRASWAGLWLFRFCWIAGDIHPRILSST